MESKAMRLFVALTCLLAGCLAQRPHPCTSPPLMSGALTVSTQNEKFFSYVLYLYDAVGQRIRLWEQGSFENKTFISDYLLHYREGVLYDIVDSNHRCKKFPLKGDFQPLGIPKTATLLSQAVIGSSSGPGEGLLINVWTGDLPEKAGRFVSTVTEFGCIPVSTLYHTDQFGWVVVSFFNNVVGIPDPSLLNTPNFCPQKEVDPEKQQKDFLSLFLKEN
ncbi:hypothetical protein Q5P01_002218 [Channa striata]|uniref:Ependymin n=1 Tax=Channa striata TaxID=64152 RepID=A0AA88TDS4_CHASR|nr:hypothetical protein Q5P01_002218 [Channa striata]